MVVNKIKKTIFVHIPKTAGTSIEVLLLGHTGLKLENLFGIDTIKNKALQHLTAKEIRDLSSIKDFSSYFRFSFVRNPYDRMISEYFWCQISGIGYKHNQQFSNFLAYAEDIVSSGNYSKNLYTDHFMPQYKFVYDDEMNLLVDFVGRFENLNKDVDIIRKKLNITAILPHEHSTQQKKDFVITEDDKKRIYNMYEKDFKLFYPSDSK